MNGCQDVELIHCVICVARHCCCILMSGNLNGSISFFAVLLLSCFYVAVNVFGVVFSVLLYGSC